MVTAADIIADFRTFDGLSPITYTRKVNAQEVEIEDALQSQVSEDDAMWFADVGTFGQGTVFNFLSEDFDGTDVLEPQAGDTITSGEVVYTVVSWQLRTWKTRWRCVCRRQVN